MFRKLKNLIQKDKGLKVAPFLFVLVVFAMTQLIFVSNSNSVNAEELLNRSVQVINPIPSAITTYEFNFDISTSGNIGSLLFQFCSNNPVYGADCVAPSGFSASSATIASQSGLSGFSVLPGQPNNQIVLSRAPTFANAPLSASFAFDNMVNQDSTGTSYVRIATFASIDASGSDIDDGGVAYAITNALDISTEVPEFLEFCAGVSINGFNCAATTGNSVDFGSLTPSTTATGVSQFMAATNAQFGYNVTINGTSLTSGNNVITATSGSTSKTGVNQFGLNLVANNSPPVGDDPQGPGSGSTANSLYAQPDHYRFKSGDTLVSAPSSDNYHKFTTSYIVNVAKSEPPGDYVSTMFFICLANF